jgi:hypothetical protein
MRTSEALMEIFGATMLVLAAFSFVPCAFATTTAKYGKKIARAKKIHIKMPVVNTPRMMQTMRTDIATVYFTILDRRSSSGLMLSDVALCLLAKWQLSISAQIARLCYS